MDFSRQPTIWISHRGCQTNHPENTLGAFEEAVRKGFSSLETDLRISRDGQIVLSHDPTLDRLCGDPRPIFSLSRKELQRIPLRGGERLLFFDEFMEAFPLCSWTFDIKPEHGEETIHVLGTWADSHQKTESLLVQGKYLVWKSRHKQIVKQYLPEAVFYAGKNECIRAGISAILRLPAGGGIRPGKIYGLPPRLYGLRLYRESIVDYYHRRDAKLLAFLPENDADVKEALRLNVDEILTDHHTPESF